MEQQTKQICAMLLLGGMLAAFLPAAGQSEDPLSRYGIYAGSTHAHTIFTLSHGAQYDRKPGTKKILFVDSSTHVSTTINTTLKPGWEKYQGLPAMHYALAKDNGYDFYVTADHSQEAGFHPTSPLSAAWLATQEEADKATDSSFVALRGYEHSENDGPGGKGHINVINSATYINALEPGIDLAYFYRWLDTVSANGDGPVVATFNHPGARQYDDWSGREPGVTDVITMLEVINSNNHIHYAGFINALDRGWKVSPVCGNDNHGTEGIADNTSRTFVLAEKRTKSAILEAMKHRRTYASLEQNIRCAYTVNDEIMGSTLKPADTYQFDIEISDPDTGNPGDRITKVDIVKDGGQVVQTYTPAPGHSVRWKPVIRDAAAKYFFVRIWNAGGGDAPHADPKKPVAWLAPVWTGK
ncbi:hypothetical protein [Compostibacter hankyongensis]|uniref:DUF3604 domain-containing protein n=1 Tax=Compostibacter hankyongensis TaxID=1007089 RepID=A0ABP8FJS2_9BACT